MIFELGPFNILVKVWDVAGIYGKYGQLLSVADAKVSYWQFVNADASGQFSEELLGKQPYSRKDPSGDLEEKCSGECTMPEEEVVVERQRTDPTPRQSDAGVFKHRSDMD